MVQLRQRTLEFTTQGGKEPCLRTVVTEAAAALKTVKFGLRRAGQPIVSRGFSLDTLSVGILA